MDNPTLIASIKRIPPLNPALMALLNALSNGDSNATSLTKIIEADANTSVTILKIANSSFYGMTKKITSIRDSCVLLGISTLRNIAFATAAEALADCESQDNIRQALHAHTIAAATIAAQLGKLAALDVSTCYTLGLLHELGKQATLVACPEYFKEFMAHSTLPSADTHAQLIEMCELGEHLASTWRLPDLFLHVIRHHINPDHCPSQSAPHVQLINIAHATANYLGYPSPGEPPGDEEPDAFRLFFEQYSATAHDEALQNINASLAESLNTHQELSNGH